MKRLAFISGVVVTNAVLVLSIISKFNPSNLPLTELEYFNGFDIANLFPSHFFSITIFYGGLLSLIIVNKLFLRK